MLTIDKVNFYEFSDEFIRWMLYQFPGQSYKGKLEHLKKEVQEALDKPDGVMEFADCLMLTVAAAYLAGHSPEELMVACKDKLAINKMRKWPAVIDPDAPVCHIRESNE